VFFCHFGRGHNRTDLRNTDPRDYAGCTDGSRSDTDLHTVGSGLYERFGTFCRCNIAGNQLQIREAGFDLPYGFQNAGRMAVCRVNHHDIHLGFNQRFNPIHHIGADTDRRPG
jgi:hypothetical protein